MTVERSQLNKNRGIDVFAAIVVPFALHVFPLFFVSQ